MTSLEAMNHGRAAAEETYRRLHWTGCVPTLDGVNDLEPIGDVERLCRAAFGVLPEDRREAMELLYIGAFRAHIASLIREGAL